MPGAIVTVRESDISDEWNCDCSSLFIKGCASLTASSTSAACPTGRHMTWGDRCTSLHSLGQVSADAPNNRDSHSVPMASDTWASVEACVAIVDRLNRGSPTRPYFGPPPRRAGGGSGASCTRATACQCTACPCGELLRALRGAVR